MNKKLLWIVLYILIVLASIFVVYMRYTILAGGDNGYFEYFVFGFFILFTYINLRKLIQLIKAYRK
ncbi:MAG TPA: hypothetical protein VL022_01695 [Moheibacter sp.]|nr:hypothetical protein [Moheibacter sp.]